MSAGAGASAAAPLPSACCSAGFGSAGTDASSTGSVVRPAASSVAHARLAAVPPDERHNRLARHFHLLGRQAHLLARLGEQILLGNLDLLGEDVARQAHNLHTVEQGAGDGVGHVGSAQEENLQGVGVGGGRKGGGWG
eukprot:scaffold20148_cov97-Isochrysis_galbana.AAC.2